MSGPQQAASGRPRVARPGISLARTCSRGCTASSTVRQGPRTLRPASGSLSGVNGAQTRLRAATCLSDPTGASVEVRPRRPARKLRRRLGLSAVASSTHVGHQLLEYMVPGDLVVFHRCWRRLDRARPGRPAHQAKRRDGCPGQERFPGRDDAAAQEAEG